MTEPAFQIKLPKFEGPFDLLLFFIERDELDIYDIPIAQVTSEFLTYIRQAQAKNIDLASSFIVVAATLMRIKAKMLIPRKQLDEEGKEIDPRDELVNRLLEYKRYKSVLETMRQLEDERANREMRGNITNELRDIATKALVDAELQSLTLFKLLRVFEALMEKQKQTEQKTVHQVRRYSYTIPEQQDFIRHQLKKYGGKADFEQIFKTLESRLQAIVTFLGLLELLNMQEISITQGEGINNFWLHSGEATPTI
jgi:segregation and condensation protein A